MFNYVASSANEIDLEALKAAVDLPSLCGMVTPLRRKTASGEYCGPCPWCGGRDRFVVVPARPGVRQGWFCRQCTGIEHTQSAIDFVMRWRGVDLPAAVEWLSGAADLAGIAIDAGVSLAREEDHRRQAEEHKRKMTEHLTAAYHEAEWRARLMDSAAAMAAMRESGITDAAIRHFGFGLTAWAGKPAITIPWRIGGLVEAVQYRFVGPCEDRYQWHRGSSGRLFNADVALSPVDDALLVTEGAKKAAAAWVAGVDSVVAVPNNTSAARIIGEFRDTLERFNRVYVLLDPDSNAEACKAARELPNGRVVALPEKLDDWLLSQGGKPAALLAAMRGARRP